MTVAEKIEWVSQRAIRLKSVQNSKSEIKSGNAQRVTYYFFVAETAWYAVETYLENDGEESKIAAQDVVRAGLEYFYGSWREKQLTPDGKSGTEAWKPFCLWYDEVMDSLPFAAVLSDWDSMLKIAAYPRKTNCRRLPKPKEKRLGDGR